jgi:hypothetical protein
MELTDENMDYPDCPDPNRPRYKVRDEDLPEYIRVGIAKRRAELAAAAKAKAGTAPTPPTAANTPPGSTTRPR